MTQRRSWARRTTWREDWQTRSGSHDEHSGRRDGKGRGGEGQVRDGWKRTPTQMVWAPLDSLLPKRAYSFVLRFKVFEGGLYVNHAYSSGCSSGTLCVGGAVDGG
jgi:hypothetical protein